MIICKICNQEFKNNLGGDLTKHINDVHDMSYENYYILTELNGIEPKCQCGLCNEKPNFRRGKFSKYAINHEKHEWQKNKYIEIYGQPKCQNHECNNYVKFHRGKPQKFCSHKCQPNNWNQDKINKTVLIKYGVENVFKLDHIKLKSTQKLIDKYGVNHPLLSDELKMKSKKTSLLRYGCENPQSLDCVKEKQKETIMKKYGVYHYSKTNTFKEIASKNMCKYNENTMSNHKIRYYKNTQIYYQSLHEYRFLEYCEMHDLLQFVENSPTFKYMNNKWHLPDFKFKNQFIIEIKSSYWLKRQGGLEKIKIKKESVESKGYQYIFILDENYEEFIKYCL